MERFHDTGDPPLDLDPSLGMMLGKISILPREAGIPRDWRASLHGCYGFSVLCRKEGTIEKFITTTL